MNAAEQYDVLVLGSGTAGKLMAWTMAKAGQRTAVQVLAVSKTR
jgi:choline dehydrogenase-like flavoprotein